MGPRAALRSLSRCRQQRGPLSGRPVADRAKDAGVPRQDLVDRHDRSWPRHTRVNWTDHGKDVPTAEFIWIAVLGPDTPPLGVREDVETTQSQVAATIAHLLGEDFAKGSPKAA